MYTARVMVMRKPIHGLKPVCSMLFNQNQTARPAEVELDDIGRYLANH